MDTEAKIEVVNKYVQAFREKNIDTIRDIFAENATVEDPVGSGTLQEGIDAICAFYLKGFAMDIELELTGAVRCAGNSVAFPFTGCGPKMRVEIIDIFEFDEAGKIQVMRAYWGPENSAKV